MWLSCGVKYIGVFLNSLVLFFISYLTKKLQKLPAVFSQGDLAHPDNPQQFFCCPGKESRHFSQGSILEDTIGREPFFPGDTCP